MSPAQSPLVGRRIRLGGRLLPAVLLGLPLLAAAEAPAVPLIPDYSAREWHLADGLPTHVLTDLRADAEGFLWIGTDEGLVRFDGRHFQTYALPGPLEEQSQAVHLLSEDQMGRLLVAPRDGGLLRFSEGRFEPLPLPSVFKGREISALLADRGGRIWAGIQRGVLLRLSVSGCRVFDKQSGLDEAYVPHMALDEEGRLWVSSGSQVFEVLGDELRPLPLEGPREELYVATARQGGPWLVGKETVYKLEGGQAKRFASIPPWLGAHFLHRVFETQEGDLLLGTRSKGLHRVTREASECLISTPDDIYSIVEDRENDLWVGSNGGGLIRLRRGILRRFSKDDGLQENYSLTVCEDRAGIMWFANRDGGLVRLRQGRLDRPAAPEGFGPFGVKALAPAADGGLWVSSSLGLLHLDGDPEPHWSVTRPGLQLGVIRGAYSTRQGDLWLACDPDRLVRVKEGKAQELGPEVGLPAESIRAFAEADDGRLWLGTTTGKLFAGTAEHFEQQAMEGLPTTRAIQALLVDSSQDLWIGTETGGLVHWRQGHAQSLGRREGLPSDNVTQILSDEQGSLWLGSPHAIYHVKRAELEEVLAGRRERVSPVLLGRDDGLPESSCVGFYQPSAWKSHDHLLWFATREGVVVIDPSRDHELPSRVQLRVDEMRVDERSQGHDGPLRLRGDFHQLEIRLAVLCLSTPSRVELDYRLEGFDTNWNRLEGEPVLRFPRLPSGSYRLELRAQLKGVETAPSTISCLLIVEPRWWQSFWFHALWLLAGALALSLGVRAWSRRRLMERLRRSEQERAVERERTRIARNIHDDLGASLTRISLLTQAAQDGSNPLIDKIYDTVSDITRSMDEIVWVVNPRYDSLGSLIYYLGNYSQKFLQEAGLRYRLESPERVPEQALGSQMRHDLFLCVKEVLNNTVKHAKATEVVLRIRVEPTWLLLELQDDGTGMNSDPAPTDANRSLRGHGLRNLRERLLELGGEVDLISKAGAGLLVRLRVPLSRLQPPSQP